MPERRRQGPNVLTHQKRGEFYEKAYFCTSAGSRDGLLRPGRLRRRERCARDHQPSAGPQTPDAQGTQLAEKQEIQLHWRPPTSTPLTTMPTMPPRRSRSSPTCWRAWCVPPPTRRATRSWPPRAPSAGMSPTTADLYLPSAGVLLVRRRTGHGPALRGLLPPHRRSPQRL